MRAGFWASRIRFVSEFERLNSIAPVEASARLVEPQQCPLIRPALRNIDLLDEPIRVDLDGMRSAISIGSESASIVGTDPTSSLLSSACVP